MRTRRPDLAFLGAALLMILVAAALIWGNYFFAINDPEGTGFVPQWLGTRRAFLEGTNPYSDEAINRAQSFVYGHPAVDGEDPQYFLYPYYAIIFFSPPAMIADYHLARAVWMSILALSMIGLAFASLSLTRWRPSGLVLAAYVLFSLGNYHAVRAVYNGNPAIIVTLLIVLAFLAIQQERDFLAGVLFGLATIKPQMVILLLPFVLLWVVSHRQWGVVFGMGVTILGLLGLSSLIQPGWFVADITQMLMWMQVSGPNTLGGVFDSWWPGGGSVLGWLMTAGFTILLVVEWWRALGKDARWFLWTAGLTLTVTILIGVPNSTSNFVFLLPVITLAFSIWEVRWPGGGRLWTLILMVLLLGGLWWLYIISAGPGPGLDQDVVMFLPLPFMAFISLYWIRYWALSSVRLQIRSMKSLRNL